jgi:hypothetical protein
MELKVGHRVEVESESTEQRPRMGIIEEVMRDAPSARYRQVVPNRTSVAMQSVELRSLRRCAW